jgi:hypothetical protein
MVFMLPYCATFHVRSTSGWLVIVIKPKFKEERKSHSHPFIIFLFGRIRKIAKSDY